jgi:drug/metabolite transporter (DMT)-like permease
MPFSISSRALAGHLAMLTFSLLVSVSFTIGALVANQIEPLAITAARFLLATILIFTFFIVSPTVTISDLKNPTRFLLLGGMISIYFVTMFEGLKTANPISMSAVFTFTPIMAGIFDRILSNRRLSVTTWASVVFGGIGALWIIFDGDYSNFVGLKIGFGEALFFVGCAGHAFYAALIPRLNRGETPLAQSFGTLLAATLILALVGGNDILSTFWLTLNQEVWLTIFYLAIFATAATFFLIQFAAARLSSLKVMAYTYAVPFWVTSLEIVLGHSSISTVLLIGGSIIFVSLVLLLISKDY